MYGAMIVSGDADFLLQAKRFVTNINSSIEVIPANSRQAAKELLISQTQIDVVVCDHSPSGIDAVALFNDMCRTNDSRPFIILTKKPDGDIAIKAFELRMDYYMSRESVMNFYGDLANKIVICAERKRLAADRSLNERRMKALINLAKMHDRNFTDILNYALEESVSLTESGMGYIATYEEGAGQLKMLAWSQAGVEKCQTKTKPIYYDYETTGIWGDPIRKEKTILINDYDSNPVYKNKKTLPTGHVKLDRLLMIPIYHNGRVVATAGVANKRSEYTPEDEMQFILLTEGLMSIYYERMLEEETLKKDANIREVIRNAPIGIMLLDNDCNVLECNDSARSLITSHTLCLSKSPLKTYTNEVSRRIMANLKSVDSSERSGVFEHSLDVNGTPSVLKMYISIARDASENRTGYTVMIDDVTETVAANLAAHSALEHMNALDRLVDERVALIIAGMDESLASAGDSPAIKALGKQLDALKDTMLFVDEYRSVGIADPVWQPLEEMICKAAEANGLPSSSVEQNTKGVKILADPKFYGVFRHLMVFSYNYGVRVTKCSVKCRMEGGNLVISYADDGVGIPYDSKNAFVSKGSADYGLGMYLAFNILRTSGFQFREIGRPGSGMLLEITVPPSRYTIDWNM